jgi:hypothetical protein
MTDWEAENPHPIAPALRLRNAAARRIPEEFKIQRIGGGHRDRMAVGDQASGNLAEMGLCPSPGWPVTLNNMENLHRAEI